MVLTAVPSLLFFYGKVVLYVLYLGLMVACRLGGLLERLEKTEQMVRAREELAQRRILFSRLASAQVNFASVQVIFTPVQVIFASSGQFLPQFRSHSPYFRSFSPTSGHFRLSSNHFRLTLGNFRLSLFTGNFRLSSGHLPLSACNFRRSGFKQVSGSGSGFRMKIRIQEGKNDPQK